MNFFKVRFLTVPLCCCFLSATHAEVIISEVLFNEVGSDVSGEWIELYNRGDSDVDLTGWRIGDEETAGATAPTEAMMFFPEGAVIKAGQFFIVAINAYAFEGLYRFAPNVEVASGTSGDNPEVPNLTTDDEWDPDGGIINLSNNQDQVLLRDALGFEVDRVSWGPSTSQLDPDAEADGQSWFRKNLMVDISMIEDWELTPIELRSTPGEGPVVEVEPINLVVRWGTKENGERHLVWNEMPGTLFYEIQRSTDLQDWKSIETVEETSWTPPQDFEGKEFYIIISR